MKRTVAGWFEGKEVVSVTFDPKRVSFEALVETAKEHGCTDYVWVRSPEQLEIAKRVVGDVASITQERARTSKDSDLLYYLRQSPLRFLPLSELQRIRVNADLGAKRDPSRWFSPRQRRLAARLSVEAERAKLGTLAVLPPLGELWRFE